MKLIKDRLFLRKIADSYTLHRIKDNILTIEGDSQYTIGGIDPFYKLSKQNCDEIFGVVDVEELAEEETKKYATLTPKSFKHGFMYGFNKALELNKDKVFTKEEVHKLLRLVHILPNFELEQFEDENNVLQIDTFISHHIQQLTEIDVEIEMQCLDPTCDGVNRKGECITTGKPKLDSEKYIILKRKVVWKRYQQ